jgi:hypothetical protein
MEGSSRRDIETFRNDSYEKRTRGKESEMDGLVKGREEYDVISWGLSLFIHSRP